MLDVQIPNSNIVYFNVKNNKENPWLLELKIIGEKIRNASDFIITVPTMSETTQEYLKDRGYKILSDNGIEIVESN